MGGRVEHNVNSSVPSFIAMIEANYLQNCPIPKSTYRVTTRPGKSWIFFLKIPGPGKSWKITLVLESPGKYPSKVVSSGSNGKQAAIVQYVGYSTQFVLTIAYLNTVWNVDEFSAMDYTLNIVK